MTTEREEFEKLVGTSSDDATAKLDFNIFSLAWQARGKLDAERIAELEEMLEMNANESLIDKTLSLQVQVLREALVNATEDIEDWSGYASEYFKDKHDLEGCISSYKTILEHSPNADEWIRKSQLELLGYNYKGNAHYKIKETK